MSEPDAPLTDIDTLSSVAPLSEDTEADDGDRAEQAVATTAGEGDGLPAPLPDSVLDSADPADAADQSREVPLDDEDWR